jgi:hypothetical protein
MLGIDRKNYMTHRIVSIYYILYYLISDKTFIQALKLVIYKIVTDSECSELKNLLREGIDTAILKNANKLFPIVLQGVNPVSFR